MRLFRRSSTRGTRGTLGALGALALTGALTATLLLSSPDPAQGAASAAGTVTAASEVRAEAVGPVPLVASAAGVTVTGPAGIAV
ncbi:hypothetical protein ABZ086_35260, partial [Streptomyces halstedii]